MEKYLEPLDDVKMVGDVAFGKVVNFKGQREVLHLDAYLPVEKAGPHPAILWLHGGGFQYGNDKRQIYIPPLARAFARLGYVGISADYRIREDPSKDWGAAAADAAADARLVLEWIKANAAEYKINPAKIALVGGSAGGITVLNLVHGQPPVTYAADGVFAVASLWGPPVGKMRLFAQPNPASPPTFIIHGTADEMVAYQASYDLVSELQSLGVKASLLTLPNAPHTPLEHFDLIVAMLAAFLGLYA